MRNFRDLVLAVILLILPCTPVRGAILLHFDQDQYTVLDGETLQVHVILDADDRVPGDQPLTQGLLGMSFQVTFDPAVASIDEALVDLPAALNDDGAGRGPEIVLESGVLKIRGALPISSLFPDGLYKGEAGGQMRLATISITRQGLGDFDLGLGFYRKLGPSEPVFVDGTGKPLDSDTAFASAKVLIPEPSSVVLLALGGLLCRPRKHVH